MKGDLGSIVFLLRRFGARYRGMSLSLVVVSVVAGFALSLQPLVLAPALNILDKASPPPATRLADLTLNNLGPTLLKAVHADTFGSMGLITVVGLMYLTIAASAALLSFAAQIMAIWLRASISRDMVQALHRKLQSLPLAFFYEHKVGDLISRYNNDVDNTAYFIDSVVRGIVQSAITAGLCFLMLSRTSPTLTLTVLGVGVVHLLAVNTLRRPIRRNVHRENVARGGLAAALQESLSNVRTVKSFAAEDFDFGRIRDTTETVRHNMLWNVFFKHLEEPIRVILNAGALVIVMLVSFRAYLAGELTISGFGLFLLLAQKTMEPTAQLALHGLAISRMLGCSTRVLELFRTPSTLRDGSLDAPAFAHQLQVQDVSFSYQSRKAPALDRISLTVRRGEMVALVGPSGGGKSTLADLIVRLHDPGSGAIIMDGRDIRDFKQAGYRQLFGVVPQECVLFNETIRDNILLGRAPDDAAFARCLRLSHSAEFIAGLPAGAETPVGDRGVLLSGGQRQRIAIARAVYGNPQILIMDEATSALDSESEDQVQRAIEDVVQGITAIVIAHRLSTVRKADRIVVIDNGRVEAVGTHAELLGRSAVYRRLCELQFNTHGGGARAPIAPSTAETEGAGVSC